MHCLEVCSRRINQSMFPAYGNIFLHWTGKMFRPSEHLGYLKSDKAENTINLILLISLILFKIFATIPVVFISVWHCQIVVWHRVCTKGG